MSKKTLQIMGASFLGAAAAIGLGLYTYRLYQRKQFDEAMHESEDWEDEEDDDAESFEDDDDDVFVEGADAAYCDKVRECLENIAGDYIWGSGFNTVCAYKDDLKEQVCNIEVEPFVKVYDPDRTNPEKVAVAIAAKFSPKDDSKKAAYKAEAMVKKAEAASVEKTSSKTDEKADLEDPDAPSEREDYWSQYAQKVVEALTKRLKPGYILVRAAGSTSVQITDKNGKQIANIEAEITAMKVAGHHDPKEAANYLADNALKSYCNKAKQESLQNEGNL